MVNINAKEIYLTNSKVHSMKTPIKLVLRWEMRLGEWCLSSTGRNNFTEETLKDMLDIIKAKKLEMTGWQT